jgi:ligand-binding sensor domain-containing protein
MPNRLFSTLCLFGVLSGAVSICSAEILPVKTYGTADGMPRDAALCIVQDSYGFMWFCTADGLSRFDGYRFINYTTEDGLPHRIVNDFLQTRAGKYWVATNGGLARFNPSGVLEAVQSSGNSATQSMFVSHKPSGNVSKSVEELFEDREGRLWCGTGDIF